MESEPKKRYIAVVKEVWYQTIAINATSLDEAKEIALDAGGTPIPDSLEYSHTPDDPIVSIEEADDSVIEAHGASCWDEDA